MPAATQVKDITHSVAHYLMAIDALSAEQGNCRAADIARMLEVSRNAVSLKLHSLRESDLVHVDAAKNISLTNSGRQEAEFIVSMRRAVKHLLVDLLGVEEEVAEQDACLVEHLLSRQTGVQLLNMFQFINQASPNTQKFIADFKNFSHSCASDSGCSICHNHCLLSDAGNSQSVAPDTKV